MKLTESYLRNIIKQELRNTLSSAGLHEAFASGMGKLYKDFVEGGFPATPEDIEASLQDESGIYEVTAVLEQLATMKQDYGKVHNKLISLVDYIVSNADKIKQAISTLKDPFDTKTKSEAMKHLEILAKSKTSLNEAYEDEEVYQVMNPQSGQMMTYDIAKDSEVSRWKQFAEQNYPEVISLFQANVPNFDKKFEQHLARTSSLGSRSISPQYAILYALVGTLRDPKGYYGPIPSSY
jgi:dGTP triphosphohydrolase